MIIKSNPITSDSLPSDIFNYCTVNDKNEHIDIINGDFQDVVDCFEDARAFNRKNSLLHIQASSKEVLTHQQFMNLRQNIIDELNVPASYVVCSSLHTYKGHEDSQRDPQHIHILLRMINPENGKPIDLSNKYQRQEKIARMFEVDNGLALVKGRHNVAVYHAVPEEYKEAIKPLTLGELPNSFLRDGQYQLQQRNGVNSFEIRNTCKELVKNCDNLQSFSNAIAEHGWTIEQGQKKLILNDENGKLVGSVDRILGMKKDEFEKFKGDYEVAKIEIASPIISRTSDDVPPDNKLAKAPPVEPLEKSTEQHQEPSQEQTTQQPQTAPEQPEISNTETSQEVKAEASEGMTQEEKLAISEFNKQLSEKEKLSKEELSNQEKRIKDFLKSMEIKQQPKLQPQSWNDIIENREKSLLNIIDQQHPKLTTINNKQVRDFLYKNFKSELDDFFDKRKTLRSIQSDIKDLKNNAYFFKNKRFANKEKQEEEERKKLILLSMYIVHSMMHKIGLNRQKPNQYDYLTDEDKNNYKLEFEQNKYAKLLFENKGRAKCLDSIAFMKVFERDAELEKWANRDEVINAKKSLSRLNDIRDINIYSLDEKGQKEFREAQKNLDIEKARKAVIEAHKREDQRYLADVRPEEKEETIEQNQNNDKEKSNVIEFPKNNKKKSFSYGR